ncbi:MAG: Imm1 family immunity protein [Actinomycetaceae bacterium]|nr:Imm1 family immunity protein [Actinomycetaceae bacterium]
MILTASYWHPERDEFIKVPFSEWAEFQAIYETVKALEPSPRGFPSIDIDRDEMVVCTYIRFLDGTCTIAYGDLDRTFWPGPFYEDDEEYLEFDFNGSYSEVPRSVAIECSQALLAVRSFIEAGDIPPDVLPLIPEC